jgi:hypothetical protein
MTAIPEGAPLTDPRHHVLVRLAKTWPADWRVTLPTGGAPLYVASHPLRGELEAFWEGEEASLPYFLRRQSLVRWVTLASGSTALQRMVEMLRAWVLPSFAWEHETEPFIASGAGDGELSEMLLTLSPAGYFRWMSRLSAAAQVAQTLRQMRAVTAKRPNHVHVQVPSLLELRQQFNVALLAGDREAAERALQSIDHHQLDSATNTKFMRVRLLDAFKDYGTIVQDPEVEGLVQVRMPHAVRTALARAFHAECLAAVEQTGNVRAAADAYVSWVHPMLGGLLALCHAGDGLAVERSAAYRAWHTRDVEAAEELLSADDPFVRPLLESIRQETPTAHGDGASLLARFETALARDDRRALQALGQRMLEHFGAGAPIAGAVTDVGTVLRGTLELQPNPELRDALLESESVAGLAPAPTATTLPQSWRELLAAVSAHRWAAARRFVSLDAVDRPPIDSITADELSAVVTTLEELLTGQVFEHDVEAKAFAAECLPAFVEDFVKESQFPRRAFETLYLHLLRLWGTSYKQSLYAPDGQVLIALAEGLLQYTADAQAEVAELLRHWWEARRVSARLPFLLEAIELLVERTSEVGTAQGLWIEAVQLLKQQEGMSHAERRLWRLLGLRIGFDEATIGEALGPVLPNDTTPDPLTRLPIKKVAIVSLHARSAEVAGTEIHERTGAEVIVVTDKVAGSATSSALKADVVLLVWSAVKHAVYRAFDTARERMVYVQGTGAASILLALDRWAAKQVAEGRSK